MKKSKGFEVKLEEPKKNKKWKKALTITAIILIPILLIFGIGIKIFTDIFNFEHDKITSNPIELGFTEKKSDDVINIALFGVDGESKTSFEGFSDVIIVASFNKTNGKVKLTSLLRDSLVPVDRDGKTSYCKLNNVYKNYGPEFAVRTLNIIFDLDISEYIAVNFTGMANIIDSLGGVEVTLSKEEVKYINDSLLSTNILTGKNSFEKLGDYEGKHTLNGVQAISYARIRRIDTTTGVSGDFGRTDRQRMILEQIFIKAKNLNLSEMINFVKTLSPLCKTSLSYFQMIEIGSDVLLSSPTFEECRVPQMNWLLASPTDKYGSILYYDLDFAGEVMHAFIYDDTKPEDYIAKNGIKTNDWYEY